VTVRFLSKARRQVGNVADVARARLFRHNGAPIVGSGSFDADSVLPDSTRFGNESGAYNYGAQAAQVHVDPQTGQVKVLSFAVASDCGTVIYPIGAEGQGRRRAGSGHWLRAHGRVADRRRKTDQSEFLRLSHPVHARHAAAPARLRRFPMNRRGRSAPRVWASSTMDPTAAVINNAIFDAGRRCASKPCRSRRKRFCARCGRKREKSSLNARRARKQKSEYLAQRRKVKPIVISTEGRNLS